MVWCLRRARGVGPGRRLLLLLGWLVLLYASGVPLGGGRPAEAGPAPPSPGSVATSSGPTRVGVGILLLSVGDLNIATSNYSMDLYLIFTCDRPCNPGDYEIMNGRPIVQELQEQTPTGRTYRVHALLRNNWDFHAYPFDRNDLTVAIEDKIQDKTKLVYLVDPAHSGIDPDAGVAGWDFAHRWKGTVADHGYPVFGETYSRYVFTTAIHRPFLVGILSLFPALILVAIGILALVLRADLGVQRLTVGTSALVATVLFHIGLRSSLPPVGYFTFADRFMIIGYVILAATISLDILMLNLMHAREQDAVERMRFIGCRAVPALWIGLQMLNVAILLTGPA